MVKQGDIIKINLNPTKGHEQSGYRPVIVINNASHSRASNMTIVCPITNTDRKNPLHVEIKGMQTTGFVMCDQIRAIDIRARDYRIIETVDEDTLWEICDIAQGLIGIETVDDKKNILELTENGYTPEFEAEILAAAEECYAAVANGTIKPYNNVAEMFAEWDKEDEEND